MNINKCQHPDCSVIIPRNRVFQNTRLYCSTACQRGHNAIRLATGETKHRKHKTIQHSAGIDERAIAIDKVFCAQLDAACDRWWKNRHGVTIYNNLRETIDKAYRLHRTLN